MNPPPTPQLKPQPSPYDINKWINLVNLPSPALHQSVMPPQRSSLGKRKQGC